MPKNRLNNQHGFSLLEVLFSMVVLSIALLATARMHALVTQDGGFSKTRAVAVNLAQEKLDDLRSFTLIADSDPAASPDECAAPVFCFSEIGANAGGQEDASGTIIISGDVSIHNTTYNRTWGVTNYYRCGTSAPSTTNCASPNAKPYPDFKEVEIEVIWTDELGNSHKIEMVATIHASPLSAEANSLAAPYNGSGPKVSYTPVGVPDAVPVPINTGGTKFKESSKPLPEVSQSGTGIEVSFDSVIYTGSGTYTKDSQEEFSTVGCECQFASGTGSGYTPTRKIWNGSDLEVKVGAPVTKVIGQTLGNSPPNNCDICCRDHHDLNSSAYPKYDPQRPDGDYTSGDHNHYYYTNCVSGGAGATNCTAVDKNNSLSSATPLTAVTSGAYLESCRVMRVNGEWRVLQDWRLRKVTILPYTFLLTDSNLTNYVNLVEEVVENAVKTDSGNTGVTISPLGGRDLTLASGAAPVQLLSRAVYVDTIYGAEDDPATTGVNELNTPDSAYYTTLLAKIIASQSASPANSAWLEFVSFYEANLTLLYDWTSDAASIATVTSEPIEAIVDPVNGYYGSFSRGKVTIQSGSTAGSATIKAKARLANSGVTGGVNRTGTSYVAGVSFGTDTDDSANTTFDTITVSRSASGTSHSITGKVLKGNSSVNVAETGSPASPLNVTANTTTGTVNSACTAQTGDSDVNAWYYTCTVSDGWTGTLTFGTTGSVYTLNDATTTTLVTGSFTVNANNTVADVIAYGNQVTLKGYVYKDNNPTGNPSPNITVANTTITFAGSSSGTCTDKVLEGSGANEKLRYACVVPKGWSGAVTIQVDATGGSYTYLSPGSTPCTGATTGSCTMLSVTSALADIDGTSASATATQQQQTNVTARR